ncbi:MAG: helix-turn-helix domain-containing protein [Candidatus Thiodiazotropha sp. (ex Troendleina suluensis)]|nr:helix-turn-helix domain-containing protein [Candidatus Thiodiazotropha sp. (ex Troendleina suluensis)]
MKRNPAMNGDQILHLLKAIGLNFTDIAQALGVTPQHVGQVAHRKGDSIRIAKALSIALNRPVEEVFPDRPQYHCHPDPAKRQQLLDAVRELNAA